MLDSLVRVSRRVDNPLLQKPRSSPLLVAEPSPLVRSIILSDFKVQCPINRKVPPPTSDTSNLIIQLIFCSQSIPHIESRHQIQLAIMLPLHLTTSPDTVPTSFSWIIRSHNTLSSSFHSFFKVLFSFPSQYFFAIGFPVIFRLWWILSPFQFILPNKFTLFPGLFVFNLLIVTRLSLSQADFSKSFLPINLFK